MAQSVKRPTSAQVTISWSVGSSPASGSVLTAWSLEPASDSVSPSLSALPPLVLALSLSLSKINKHLKHFFKKFNVYLFLRQRETEHEWGRAEREGDTESEAGSRLQAVSTEPDMGLEPMNREIMT